jgi:energy-coupling factor transporter ATP-binding protein EcfA2
MLAAEALVAGHPGAENDASARPLDLVLEPGTWLGVAGGNGSGKTALLLTLAGLAPPRQGRVVVDGLDLADPAQAARARGLIGVVFQEPETQFVTDRVERELAFPLENLGWSRPDIERRVDELLALFGLEALAAAPPDRLSGGEMQRVALAAAAGPRPRYYLLDEPASYLDPASRTELLDWTRARVELEGAGVVWTECEGSACEGADRVLELPGSPSPVFEPAPSAVRTAASGTLWQGKGLRLVRQRPGGRERTLWGGLDLSIAAGERVALVGANGSGKTALLETLAGWLAPTAGTLERPPLAQVGYMLQFPEFQLFAPTALEDVRFGMAQRDRFQRGPAFDARAGEFLARVGLPPARFAERAPESLSLGERRRLALAGILATEPLALLLDEPTAGLDSAGSETLLRIMLEASERGTAVVVATHDPRVAARAGARTIALPNPEETF